MSSLPSSRASSPAPGITTHPPESARHDHEFDVPAPTGSMLFKTSRSPTPSSHSHGTSSPSHSPRRFTTDPDGALRIKSYKRLVICCDGTWQDGLAAKERSQYTNVLKLTRAINREDERLQPPIHQIVYYQAGVGTDDSLYSKYVEGTTGGSLADKVEEAYAFIAHNYSPGDEIFLFGFSRGAYTARMVAQFIGEIGILDQKEMDDFSLIFKNYQSLGKTNDPKKKKILEDSLAKWRDPESKGKKRADIDGDKFTVKFLGVWDTVGALGLPEEVPFKSAYKLFGFNDSLLGDHIERAVQALALHEKRLDFNCNKLKQTEIGRSRKQYVKQVWFAGCHTDIGGGYDNHDLSDLTLAWMAGELAPYLSLDMFYLQDLVTPAAPYGTQQPHDSSTGIFTMAREIVRELPKQPNDAITHEFIHPSVQKQAVINPQVAALIKKYPNILCALAPIEQALETKWPYDPKSKEAIAYEQHLKEGQSSGFMTISTGWFKTVARTLSTTSSSFSSKSGKRTSIVEASKTTTTTSVTQNGDTKKTETVDTKTQIVAIAKS
ncbi:hypothetical protein CPB83DRAFT_841726 [Crepidotus variabilis]|uniref:T6SS Phospholipase effector Tle1-like catalytic domain-containing protein n=1 Tax=Crepidotus variabilis TaxID=179855 RepID=A0A9P6JWT3_9AGAR|nr:hypothetical protein CPB83DRAFT_841726 [Crepidotus variabilis]